MTANYGRKVLYNFTIWKAEGSVACYCVIFVSSRTAFLWLQDVSKQAYTFLFDWHLMNIHDCMSDSPNINKKVYDYEAFLCRH
jgi:hypothetical protein